jgi:hypothetical protein
MIAASALDTTDRLGNLVQVGTKVRLLEIEPSVLEKLPHAIRVRSMEGEIFEIYEVDEWGSAWVQKWWQPGESESLSHSLALKPSQMEVVGEDSAAQLGTPGDAR